jgi:hypothetical protein
MCGRNVVFENCYTDVEFFKRENLCESRQIPNRIRWKEPMQEIMPVSNELRVMLAAAEPEIQQYVLALQTKITQLLAHNGKQELKLAFSNIN